MECYLNKCYLDRKVFRTYSVAITLQLLAGLASFFNPTLKPDCVYVYGYKDLRIYFPTNGKLTKKG